MHAYNEKTEKRNSKRNRTDNQECIKTLWSKRKLQYPGILEAGTIKQTEMKVRKKYLRRTRKLLETKLCSRSLIKGMNNWAFSFERYSGPFLKWTRVEFRQMDQKPGKL